MIEQPPIATGAGNVPVEPAVRLSAGAQLAHARQAAGLTLDAVAQQLKLAPRQVKALEDNDFDKLPGRTFVRGFVRNYARLMHLDPNAIVAALPGDTTPSLDSPPLHATAQTMGRLPSVERGKLAWTRWAIPLVLIAIIAAAIYDYRQRGEGSGAPATPSETAVAPANPATSPGRPAKQPQSTSDTAAPAVTLTNPLAATEPATATSQGAATAAPPENSAPLPGTSTLVLTYRDSSWTEVRDHDGRVLLLQMNRAGQTRELSGAPPFELVIGNATEVSLVYRGVPIDLAPYTTKGIARLSLE